MGEHIEHTTSPSPKERKKAYLKQQATS